MSEEIQNNAKPSTINVFKSKFLRSIALKMISIFMIVIIVIVAVAFFSFTSEINKDIIAEKQRQLEVIEGDISQRMEEVSSIAYSVASDKAFYLEPIESDKYSGYEMSSTLARYLAGNDFIEHLAFYRLSEPDVIYVSSGEISMHDFWVVNMGMSDEDAKANIEAIQNLNTIDVTFRSYGDDKGFLAYAYPLPQFAKKAQGFVLMLIPISEINPILKSQFTNCFGELVLFDASGNEIYRVGNFDKDNSENSDNSDISDIPDIPIDINDCDKEKYFSFDGKDYVMQKTVSKTNGWSYVSVIRTNDIISETANRQLLFIVLLLVIMLVAIFLMLLCIVKQYKPINKLAMTIKDKAGESGGMVDEKLLLSDTLAEMNKDREQKDRFEAAYLEAAAANKAKSAFLSSMSHDIRTPMNAIVGMTEIALSNSDNPEYVKECLQKVQMSSRYLLDIINNVLDMSRIESGKFELSNDVVELPKLIYSIISILNQSAAAKNQRFIVKNENIIDESVIGDNIRITQVFVNILSNSVKFTPNGGTISLSVSQSEKTDKIPDGYGDYTFVFTDTGIGMSPEFISRVFDTFTRDEKVRGSRIEGTGLGMAIAKNFVEMMGGEINCESELEKGTTFTVNLRMRLSESRNIDREKYKNISALVIGGESYSAQFGALGITAEYAVNASAADTSKSYDYIIINQTDDDVSGIETVSELRKTNVGKAAFVLAAGDLLAAERSAAYNAGITAFVQAPLFKSTIVGILERNFDRKKPKNENGIVDLTGKRILLVEDNQINRTIARAQLAKTKAEVVEAENGKIAVDTYCGHSEGYFDIILMDVQMPVMNGYEATAAIRSAPRSDAAAIPIYAMTANTFDEDVRQVREAGMNGHLGKPYESRELYGLLENALSD